MSASISVIFFIRPSRANKNGQAPIYLRVNIGEGRFNVSTRIFLDPKQWSSEFGKMKGNTDEARKTNKLLDSFRMRAFDYQRSLMEEGKPVTIENIRLKWYGRSVERPHMILEVFEQHNQQMAALVGREFAQQTWERYDTAKRHTQAFMQWKYKVDDMEIKNIKYQFITDFEFWLKSERKCDHNTTMKYLANFKKIVIICVKNGWLDRYPFYGFRMTLREVERTFLSQEELDVIASKTFLTDRVNQVRDIFLFSCYTGLAYIDTRKLSWQDIGIGMDGEKWIFTHRQKTDTASRIPLLPPALKILARYQDHPQCAKRGRLLPVLSNQKMNCYLKEIADICGITKKMTTHTARHTFATTVTLTNGVPIETVGRMLGHKNLKTTQHYAKILDKKVSEDMRVLREKFSQHSEEKAASK